MEFEYKILKTEDGDTETCDSCGSEAHLCEFDNYNMRDRLEKPKVLLCEICSSTSLSSGRMKTQHFRAGMKCAICVNISSSVDESR